ncbi:MAG: TetR/AcrR family transcriptional regulator [Phycisphaeraceae bacterium]
MAAKKSPRQSASGKRYARRWREADVDERRQIITEIALDLLQRKGIETVTMRTVAQALGIGAMTLYTYVEGKQGLQREMVRRGFEMLNQSCAEAFTLHTDEGWRGGARAYLRFAIENPNLYKLMFDQFMAEDDKDLLHGGFQHLFDKVKERMGCSQQDDPALDREARAKAGRFWIALHGLATLAIAGRLVVLEGGLDDLLDDLLRHVAPDVD